MFAVAEGCGDYSGIRNFAMVIEGEDLKAGKSYGDNVIDVKPDTKFEYLEALKYRITFDRDTFVNIEGIRPVFAKFTGQDAVFKKDNNEDYVFMIRMENLQGQIMM